MLPVLDLRLVCTEAADYSNAIEPSSVGGAKIARAICQIIGRHDFGGRQAIVFP